MSREGSHKRAGWLGEVGPARHNETHWLFLLLSAAKYQPAVVCQAQKSSHLLHCRVCENSGDASCYWLFFAVPM